MKEIIDKVLEEKLNKYSPAEVSLGTNLKQAIENASKAEMIIPVVGTQGMGKSTLINAILQENILPEGADETTCVPVEVHYGEKHFAEVHFKDDKATQIVHTRQELDSYVDNNSNPANEQQVSHIVLFRSNELLKKGLIIVDLPGLDSLTKENGETTLRYMENVGSAIFLTNINPPITRPESVHLKLMWAQFSSVIFVQNEWGETEQDIQDSVEFHMRVFSQIADEIKVPFDKKVFVVNVRKALDGVLQQNPKLIESSRISSLLENLDDLVQNWDETKADYLNKRINQAIEASVMRINELLKEQDLESEEVVRQRREKLSNYQETTRQLRLQADEIERLMRQKGDDIYRTARDKAKICADNIRNDMFAVIDNGIYDGDNLENAFGETQKKYTAEFFDQVFSEFQLIEQEVKVKYDEMGDILQNNDFTVHIEEAGHRRQFKWEQNLDAVMGVIGGIAAFAICNAWNPAGWVAGAVVVISGLITSALGFLGKKSQKKKRAKETKKIINEPIDKIERALRKATEDEFNKFKSGVTSSLEQLLEQRFKEEKSMESTINEPIEKDSDELDGDLNYFMNKKKELNYV